MRKILTSRFFRCLICAILVCSLLVLSSPIRAQADIVSGGLIAAGATGAVVSVPVAIAVGATLICLGVMADAVSQNPFALQQVASQVEQHLTAAGTFVKDGMVEMYRFVTETGEAVYYAAADFMESCRSYLFDSGTVSQFTYADSGTFTLEGTGYSVTADAPFTLIAAWFPGTTSSSFGYVFAAVSKTYDVSDFYINGNKKSPWMTSANYYFFNLAGSSGSIYYSEPPVTNVRTIKVSSANKATYKVQLDNALTGRVYTDASLSLGILSLLPIDGTSARTWSEAYANRGLYIATGGSQNPDDGGEGNDGWKFLLPLAFLAGADLWAMSQADQWTGSTPPEFGDYTTEEELTVTPAPEFDGYQAIEIAPLPNPDPDPGTGTDPDPGTGTNPDPGTGTNPDPGTGTNPDPGTNSGSSSWTPPSDMGKFTLDLKQYFPFCIPFDLYAFFTCLNAEPVAPVIEWIIPLPGGKTYPFEIDLSAFDSVAQILRRMQLLLFCVGLAFKTRDLIKG